MKKLLSLPPNLVEVFHEVTGLSRDEYFCTCDPVGHRLGSGGGTAWLLQEAYRSLESGVGSQEFDSWLCQEKRILIHAGGQSKRLPSYAVSGKVLMPLPVFRWERGQRLSQNLLSVQLPLYEKMMAMAPDNIHTMVVSGDVLIRATQPLQPIPEADVVCYGLWLDASVAKNHGVFVSSRQTPSVLKQMLQKPSVQTLTDLQRDHFYLTDIGVWLLSDRAVSLLMQRSALANNVQCSMFNVQCKEYDLYSEFGCCLGTDPTMVDEELRQLKVAILPLAGGEFYHFGTSREMISSTLRLQNLVNDQREIMHLDRKPHPSIFVQNTVMEIPFTEENRNIWIENSHIGKRWHLTHDHVITGVPENDWDITLAPGECIDVVPVTTSSSPEIRRYRIDEPLNSNELAECADLRRLFAQRKAFCKQNWSALANNWRHSVFYQLDLADAASEFQKENIPLPPPLPEEAPLMTRIHDAMFRGDSDKAFSLLRHGITSSNLLPPSSFLLPRKQIADDQIVWGRSPVRIDIAGGWTDTPPYCLMEGGNVINLAIELNGQPPLQAYVKPSKDYRIVWTLCTSVHPSPSPRQPSSSPASVTLLLPSILLLSLLLPSILLPSFKSSRLLVLASN